MSGAIVVSTKDRLATIDRHLEAATPRMLQLARANGIDVTRAKAIVHGALLANPRLLSCTPYSIVKSALNGVELGLEVGGILGEAYLVPYRDTCTLVTGYKGLTKLALQHPRVLAIDAHVVRQGDAFDWDEGSAPFVKFKSSSTQGDVTHAFARAQLAGPACVVKVMHRWELDQVHEEARKKLGQGYFHSPWKLHQDAMFEKCPVRSLCGKRLPLSEGLRRALEVETQTDAVADGADLPDDDKEEA